MQSCFFRFWLRLIPPVAHQWHRIIKTVSINDIDQCNSLLQPHKYVPSVYPFSSASSVSSVFSASPVSLLSLPLPLSLLFALKSKLRHTMEPNLIPTSAERHLKLFFPIANAQLTCNAFNGQNGGESPADWLRAGIWDGHFGILLRRRRWTIQFLISKDPQPPDRRPALV